MASSSKVALTATGQTGNNTHAGVIVPGPVGPIALVLVIEAVGATPTVTWKFQGSFDNSVYTDVFYLPLGSDTGSAATQTQTAIGAYGVYFGPPGWRWFPYFRVVTTANTNVTYRGEAWVPRMVTT